MRTILAAATLAVVAVVLAIWSPPPVLRAYHWAAYRLGGKLPDPIVAGRNGRLFLGHHEGSPPGSLLADVCGVGIGPQQIGKAESLLRPVLTAGAAAGVPFRLVIVPTAPRLYPEDLPAGTPCPDPAADRLVSALHDPAVVYPLAAMQSWKTQYDVQPRRHFHWAGEAPLRVAELVAAGMGLPRQLSLPLKHDNRASDLNGFYPGLGLHDRIMEPDLKTGGVRLCVGKRCDPPVPDAVVAYTHPGPGRILVLADSFGDEIGGLFSEYAGQVWLVQMNVALGDPPDLAAFHPNAIVVVYHDAGTLALDAASQASLALAAKLVAQACLPSAPCSP